MPIADMLIDNAFGHRVNTFLDGNVGYNQIFMSERICPKQLFIVLVLSVYLNGF
jgi:hypothetical protein